MVWRYLNPPNGSPVAVNDAFPTAYETAVSDTVATNDSDPDGDPLSFQTTLPQQPTNGTASLDAVGNFVYTPNAGFSGEDEFSYEVCDPDNACVSATVTITVSPPVVVANDDTAETMLNTAVPIGVTANDQGDNLVDYHEVASGETLESIATAYNISESELARINGLYVYQYGYYGYDYYGYDYCCGYGGAYPGYGYYYS